MTGSGLGTRSRCPRKWIVDRTQEMVRDAQAEVLRGMERFVTAFQVRMRAVEADLSNVRTAEQISLANIEDRLAALELKLLGGECGSQ